jgi:hypothetical protein
VRASIFSCNNYFSLHSPDCHSLLLKCWLMNRCQQFYSPSTVLCSYLSPSLLPFFKHVSDVVSDAVSDGVCLFRLNTHRPKSILRESASTLTDHSCFPTKPQQWAPTILVFALNRSNAHRPFSFLRKYVAKLTDHLLCCFEIHTQKHTHTHFASALSLFVRSFQLCYGLYVTG